MFREGVSPVHVNICLGNYFPSITTQRDDNRLLIDIVSIL